MPDKKKVYVLVSTHGNKTFMMTSYELNTMVILANPVKVIDNTGNTIVYYSTINIRKM